MIGRLTHYLKKAKIEYRKGGVLKLIPKGAHFLFRRKFFLDFIVEALEYQIFSRFRNIRSTILEIPIQKEITGHRLILYASYDPESKISSCVMKQLQFFHQEAYQIIFISTSPRFTKEEADKIKDWVTIAIHRKNLGYDFASWKLGYTFIMPNTRELESLILLNDSCEGPEFELTEILKKMRSFPQAVYGISKSMEIAEHIQSYFYHFGKGLLNDGIVEDFFKRIRILTSKWGVVRFLEIGSSKWLIKKGISLKALIDPMEPAVSEKMSQFDLTEPTREPLASEWVRLKISPFYKKSNLKEKCNEKTHH